MKRLFKIGFFAAILVAFTGTLHAEEGLEEVWYKEVATDPTEQGRGITATSDGGYIVAGQTSASLPNQALVGARNGIVTKYNVNGEIEWQKLYYHEGAEELWSIAPTSDGGYIAAGYAYRSSGSIKYGDGWLLKIDSKGNEEWQCVTDYDYFDIFHNAVELDDGGFLATGTNGSDVVTYKVDKNGNKVSEKLIDVDGGNANNFSGLTRTTKGTFLISGSVDASISVPGRIIFVVEVDQSGNEISTNLYQPFTRNFANFTSITATSDGGFIYSAVEPSTKDGVRTDYGVVVKCDSNYAIEWKNEYENFSITKALVYSNGYAFTGYTGSHPDYSTHILTVDSKGNDISNYTVVNSAGENIYTNNAILSKDNSFIMMRIYNGMSTIIKVKITSEEDTAVTPPVDNNQEQNNNQNQGSNQTQNGVNTANSGGNTTSSNAIAPATGDTTNVVLLMSLMLLSVLTISKLKVKKY